MVEAAHEGHMARHPAGDLLGVGTHRPSDFVSAHVRPAMATFASIS